MASGEEARRPSVTHSSVGLESLFPVGESEQASGDANPELVRLRERLQGWLSQYEPLLLWVQRLLVWERPLHSIFVALTLNTLFWLLSSTSLRPIFLLSVSLLGLMLLERWKHKLPLLTVKPVEANPVGRESVQPQLLSLPELSHHLAESYLTFGLFLQETLQYKRQNQGKFCAMVCSSCLVLMGVGHYVPGIMISYIIALSVLLWPLVVYHELIQRMYTGLEPILMKLDYSMKGDPELRKRKVKKEVEEGDEPRAETESESEEELSCFAPTVDAKTTALAMAITDSELSDEEASILESGGFSVSRATTPQLTDVSEDLDQQSVHSDPEEAFLRDLPDFPSVEEFPSLEQSLLRSPPRSDASPQAEAPGEGEHPLLSPASLLLQHLASPLHFVNTHFNGHVGDQAAATAATLLKAAAEGLAGEEEEEEELAEEEEASALALGPRRSLEALSEEIVSTAISTVVQNTLSALLRSTQAGEDPALAPFLPTESPPSALESPPAAAAQQPLEDSDVALGTGPDDTPVQTEEEEEEDFELLDQSELEQMDERPSPDGQAPPSDTPQSPRQPLDS